MVQIVCVCVCVCVYVCVCVCSNCCMWCVLICLQMHASSVWAEWLVCVCLLVYLMFQNDKNQALCLKQDTANKINDQQSIHFVNRCTQTTIMPMCFPKLPPFPEDWQHSAACYTFQIFHVNKWFGWIIQMQRRSNCLLFSHCLQILQTILKLIKSLLSPNKMTNIVWNSFWWFGSHRTVRDHTQQGRQHVWLDIHKRHHIKTRHMHCYQSENTDRNNS